MSQNLRLKQVRVALNKSQAEFAVEAGVKQEDISRMERTAKLSQSVMLYLFKKDVNLNWIINGEGDMFLTSPVYTKTPKNESQVKGSDIEYNVRTKSPESIQMLEKFLVAYKDDMLRVQRDLERVKKIVLEAQANKKI